MMGQQVQWPAGTQRVVPVAEGQFITLAGELLLCFPGTFCADLVCPSLYLDGLFGVFDWLLNSFGPFRRVCPLVGRTLSHPSFELLEFVGRLLGKMGSLLVAIESFYGLIVAGFGMPFKCWVCCWNVWDVLWLIPAVLWCVHSLPGPVTYFSDRFGGLFI
jgi:hypothetical protein